MIEHEVIPDHFLAYWAFLAGLGYVLVHVHGIMVVVEASGRLI